MDNLLDGLNWQTKAGLASFIIAKLSSIMALFSLLLSISNKDLRTLSMGLIIISGVFILLTITFCVWPKKEVEQ